MIITLNNLGKRYHRNWIFRNLNETINRSELVAITGHNGSGKSTLLNAIGGFVTPSEGKVLYNEKYEFDQTEMAIAAPYLNLIEELTFVELLKFHSKFKKPLMSLDQMAQICHLEKVSNRLVREFSSGMKQRVKLVLAFCFDSKLLLLDEPTVNLDAEGVDWYFELMKNHRNQRTTIIASNEPKEYVGANQVLSLLA